MVTAMAPVQSLVLELPLTMDVAKKKKKKKREREIYFDSRTFLKIIIIDKYISIGMEKK